MSTVIKDWRRDRPEPPPGHSRRRGNAVHMRRAIDVTGVTLHQTATNFGPADLFKREQRAWRVRCHAMAFRHGVGILAAPALWYINHGNGWNGTDLGLECEGLFAGIDGNDSTVWGGGKESEKTELLAETIRETLRALVIAARNDGCPLKWLHSHRQSSATRRSDPGQWIWQETVSFAERELGLEVQLEKVMGDGRPVPCEWDLRSTAKY